MRRTLAILSMVALALAQEIPPKGVEVVEFGHGWQTVTVSMGDVNRIVCEKGNISTVVYSQEKEMQVKTEGRNVFVKFVPKETPEGKKTISDIARELYVECAGEVFQLLLYPKKIPAVTVFLKSPYKRDTQKAREFETASPFEELITSLIKMVYLEELPDGYSVEQINKQVKTFQELDLILYRKYKGETYTVEEYIINAKMGLQLHEGAFLPYLQSPVAISIVKPILKNGESTRMIVVRRGQE